MSSQLILNQVIKQIFAFSNIKYLPSQLRKFSTNSKIDQLKKEGNINLNYFCNH